MTGIIEFRKEALLEAERDFSKLQLSPESKKVIAGSAQLWAKFLPIGELAMKGFIAMAMRDFQVREKIDAGTINEFPKEKREHYIKMMMNILQEKLERVLLRAEQKPALQAAVKKVYEFSIKMIDQHAQGKL